MKFVLNIDVQKKDGRYTFTVHSYKKATTFSVEFLSEGFKKVEEMTREVTLTSP